MARNAKSWLALAEFVILRMGVSYTKFSINITSLEFLHVPANLNLASLVAVLLVCRCPVLCTAGPIQRLSDSGGGVAIPAVLCGAGDTRVYYCCCAYQ